MTRASIPAAGLDQHYEVAGAGLDERQIDPTGTIVRIAQFADSWWNKPLQSKAVQRKAPAHTLAGRASSTVREISYHVH
jgi:hypothetical protein